MVAALIERGIDGREGVIWGVHRCSLSMLPILFSSIHHISEWVHYCGQPNCNFSKNESVNQSYYSQLSGSNCRHLMEAKSKA